MPEKKLSCYSAVILWLRLLPKTAGYEPSKKVELQPGETQTVTLSIKGSDLAFVNSDGQWVLEQGDFRMQCGNQVLTITYK